MANKQTHPNVTHMGNKRHQSPEQHGSKMMTNNNRILAPDEWMIAVTMMTTNRDQPDDQMMMVTQNKRREQNKKWLTKCKDLQQAEKIKTLTRCMLLLRISATHACKSRKSTFSSQTCGFKQRTT
jgi:predicted YcjX-like family ATPase